jgi:preprotein translocase subunit YajC
MAIIDTLLDFFIPSAYAAGSAAAPQGGNFSLIFIMLGMVAFIYFTTWRPQSKRAKEQREMLGGLKQDDEVITIGGMLGKVTKLTESYVVLATSESTQITVQKSAVSTVLPKGTMKSI